MLRIPFWTALLALPAISASANGTDERALAEHLSFSAAALNSDDPLRGSDPNTCGSAPLPITPTGPSVETVWRNTFTGNEGARVIAWRIPCSPTDSMVVITLAPLPGAAETFVCQGNIVLLQTGGLQTDSFYFRNDPPTSGTFCGDVIQPVTVAILRRSSTPAAIDFDQGMSIAYSGVGTGPQPLSLPAYDPSQYAQVPPPGPNSVEVFVRGSGAHYRNCTITTAPAGGATQYTASCGSETSLKHGAFERFDY